jgi:type II secretory pathway component PulF
MTYSVLSYMGIRLPEVGLLRWWLGSVHSPILLRVLSERVMQSQPIDESIAKMAAAYPVRRIAKKLRRAAEEIRAGATWYSSLQEQRLLRKSQSAVLSAAQRAGNLQWALEELAAIEERQLSERARNAARLISPAVILLLSCPVAVFAVAMIAPVSVLIQGLSR